MSRLRIALVVGLVAQFFAASPGAAVSPYLLPASAGTALYTYQGNSSAFDHVAANGSQYAWDFTVGTTEFEELASRGGTVIGARSDSTNTSCRDLSCWKDANYVLVDHGDGTSALYLHLATGSVKVKVGQAIARGDPLGQADSTGFSYGTHLHFMVESTPSSRTADGWWWTQSVAITFADAGLPLEGHTYISQNVGPTGSVVTPSPTVAPTPDPHAVAIQKLIARLRSGTLPKAPISDVKASIATAYGAVSGSASQVASHADLNADVKTCGTPIPGLGDAAPAFRFVNTVEGDRLEHCMSALEALVKLDGATLDSHFATAAVELFGYMLNQPIFATDAGLTRKSAVNQLENDFADELSQT